MFSYLACYIIAISIVCVILQGQSCPYRHEPLSRGTEVICEDWEFGKCVKTHCEFRHMRIQVGVPARCRLKLLPPHLSCLTWPLCLWYGYMTQCRPQCVIWWCAKITVEWFGLPFINFTIIYDHYRKLNAVVYNVNDLTLYWRKWNNDRINPLHHNAVCYVNMFTLILDIACGREYVCAFIIGW